MIKWGSAGQHCATPHVLSLYSFGRAPRHAQMTLCSRCGGGGLEVHEALRAGLEPPRRCRFPNRAARGAARAAATRSRRGISSPVLQCRECACQRCAQRRRPPRRRRLRAASHLSTHRELHLGPYVMGANVARVTPDRKVGNSNISGLIFCIRSHPRVCRWGCNCAPGRGGDFQKGAWRARSYWYPFLPPRQSGRLLFGIYGTSVYGPNANRCTTSLETIARATTSSAPCSTFAWIPTACSSAHRWMPCVSSVARSQAPCSS